MYIYIYCVKNKTKLPHKICFNIFLHPGRREYHIIYVYNMIIVQVRYITIETKEVARIGYNRFLFPLHMYIYTHVKALCTRSKVPIRSRAAPGKDKGPIRSRAAPGKDKIPCNLLRIS